MKKISILSQPIRIDEIGFMDEDFYDQTALRTEKLHAKQLRQFRHQTA
jgi:hypothetical protein